MQTAVNVEVYKKDSYNLSKIMKQFSLLKIREGQKERWCIDFWMNEIKPNFYDKKIFLSGCHAFQRNRGKEMILKLYNEEENVYKYQITKKE